MPKTGRPHAIAAEHYPLLTRLAHAQPYSSQAELAQAFHAETSITAHPDTFAKALKLAGIVRVKERAKGSFQSPEPRKSYGYTEAHRRQLPEQRYPSCLTDAEWTLVADLLEVSGGRGVPPRHSRRTLLEACCYVVRTGCSWRMLPHEFPHWDNVYKTFRRWSAQGKFEQRLVAGVWGSAGITPGAGFIAPTMTRNVAVVSSVLPACGAHQGTRRIMAGRCAGW